MFKRIMVLTVMIGLLFVILTSRSANAWANCGCSMTCGSGGEVCQFNCTGDNWNDIDAAIATCCSQADNATPPLECPAN